MQEADVQSKQAHTGARAEDQDFQEQPTHKGREGGVSVGLQEETWSLHRAREVWKQGAELCVGLRERGVGRREEGTAPSILPTIGATHEDILAARFEPVRTNLILASAPPNLILLHSANASSQAASMT